MTFLKFYKNRENISSSLTFNKNFKKFHNDDLLLLLNIPFLSTKILINFCVKTLYTTGLLSGLFFLSKKQKLLFVDKGIFLSNWKHNRFILMKIS